MFDTLITNLAGRPATYILGFGVGIILLWRRRWILLSGWGIAILGNSALNAALKLIFQRPRPTLPDPFLTEGFYSFPSGHAMTSVVMFGMLSYILAVLWFKKTWLRLLLIATNIILMLFIGFSRLYLGVHFFSDVIAGYVVAAGWLVIAISITEVARRRRRRRQVLSNSHAEASSRAT